MVLLLKKNLVLKEETQKFLCRSDGEEELEWAANSLP
jgi:hypothetical protein